RAIAGVSNFGCAMKKWKMSPRSVIWRTPRALAASSASRNGPSSPGLRPTWQSAKTARIRRNDSARNSEAGSGYPLAMRIRAAAILLALLAAGRLAAAPSRPLSASDAPRADASVRRVLANGDATLDVIVGVREETSGTDAKAAPRREAARGESERRA